MCINEIEKVTHPMTVNEFLMTETRGCLYGGYVVFIPLWGVYIKSKYGYSLACKTI